MKYLLTLLVSIISVCFLQAQFLILPSNFVVKTPPIRFLSKLAMTPNINEFMKGEFPELDEHYQKVVTETMNTWFLENFPDSKVYNPQDSIINVKLVQKLIHREHPIYESMKRKPLFGYSGSKLVEGAYTKKEVNKLFEAYDSDFVIFTSILSLHRKGLFKSYEAPDYLGHYTIYAWIVDTETGEIANAVQIDGKEFPKMSASSRDDFSPIFGLVNDKDVIRECKKIQRKLKRKMNRLYE